MAKKSKKSSINGSHPSPNPLNDAAAPMPNIWAIGDVQGCYEQLVALLNHPEIRQDPHCKFWFAGDIINRGPGSLKTLQLIMSLGDRAITVLGNHDIHLLSVAAGIRRVQRMDTLDEILNAKHKKDYIDWLRHRPLAHFEHNHLMVHAGVMQDWTAEQTISYANEVSEILQSKQWRQQIIHLFGNSPNRWSPDLKGARRHRVIVNALTRMRMCRTDGTMDFNYKGSPALHPEIDQAKVLPWFELPNRKTQDTTIIFGHWSALGLLIRPHLLALDTGCVWGGRLTAIRLHDRKLIQIPYCSRLPQTTATAAATAWAQRP